MKKYIFIELLFLCYNIAVSQTALSKKWDWRFGGTNDDYVTWFQQTFDGGYIVGGSSNSDSSGNKSQNSWGSYDCWVVKVDSTGNKQWDKRFGGTGYDVLNMVQQTSDSGYILGGWSSSGIGGDKTLYCWGGYDYWIIKIDKNGNKQWDGDYGGALDDILVSLQQTDDGGYILTGTSNSPISGNKTQDNWDPTYQSSDYWIVKIDKFGTYQWDKRFGGIDNDGSSSIVQTSDGGYLVAGSSDSDSSGDVSYSFYNGGYNWGTIWLVKIDANGNKKWDKQYSGPIGSELDQMIATSDGGYILAGVSSGDTGYTKSEVSCGDNNDYWVVKIDSAGDKLWDKDYGGTQNELLNTITQTLDGGFLLAGWSFSNQSCDKSENNLGDYQTWIVKTDSAGNKQWDKTIFTTGSDLSGYALQSKNGAYIVANGTEAGIGGYKSQPNWDPTEQTNDYWIVEFVDSVITGIPLITANGAQVTISPNPFTTDVAIAIQMDNLKEADFIITNLLGQPVYTQTETNLSPTYTKMLDLSYLPNGIYFVEVVVDGERVVKEVVKE